ncbi:uncharacterized protein LOC111707774 [Eurytemora carolleeae]|uniref:uncharacterized protein LOC111707774 n=1 Tax=Eurytemora carolleeae TaxID=1294199 RepID=UPI000C759E34|nr:uncharacterized protein LOC111707774 [Eurytemora carolleeae]|eukprot:XP_023336693.1 uncharacterized protein LOC111707774 [Eurytemora affinis]
MYSLSFLLLVSGLLNFVSSRSLEPEVDVYSKLPGYDPDLLVDEEELRIATQPIHLSRSSHPTLHQESGRIPRIQEKRSVLKRIPRQHPGPAQDIDMENRIYYLPQYWRGTGDEIPATGMSLNTEIPRLSLDLGEDLTDEDGLMIPTSSLHDTLLRDIQMLSIPTETQRSVNMKTKMAKDSQTNQIYTKHYPRRFWEENAEDEEDRDENNEKRIYQNLTSSALQIRPQVVKRSPSCLRRCLSLQYIHPAQCHSFC